MTDLTPIDDIVRPVVALAAAAAVLDDEATRLDSAQAGGWLDRQLRGVLAAIGAQSPHRV